tara:strand:+ start:1823 stop:2053 length:231 start_codon:yes stop_codon:yes gene_type:complete
MFKAWLNGCYTLIGMLLLFSVGIHFSTSKGAKAIWGDIKFIIESASGFGHRSSDQISKEYKATSIIEDDHIFLIRI